MGKNILSSPGALYRKRRRDYWRQQYKAIRSVVDLTIALYILIPGLLLLGRLYYGLWTEALPEVLSFFSVGTAASLLFLFTTIRGLILHVEAADILFLRTHGWWMTGIKLRGMLTSFGVLAILTTIGGLLLAPFLIRNEGWGAAGIVLLCAVAFVFRTVHMLLLHLSRVKWTGWRSVVAQGLSHAVLFSGFNVLILTGQEFPAVMAGAALLVALAAAGLAVFRIRLQGTFYADVNEDLRQKTRLTTLLLSQAVDKPKRPSSKPLLLRRSNKLFPYSRVPSLRVAEAAVKSIIRERSMLRMYAIYTVAGAAVLQLPPYPVNIIVFIGLVILLGYWMNGLRRRFMEDRFMTLLPPNEALAFKSASPAMRLLLLPSVAILTLSLGWALSHVWWGIACGFAAGFPLAWWLGSWKWEILGDLRWKGRRKHLSPPLTGTGEPRV
ncbi:ABC transporter permease [Paenibacillus caui]|uniref:ABC transporter permease n=1 Tax=Paenibacillus caui TaxID=2873927 RepID=UPI001CA81B4F|nr:ABC transporter permease [Paenibacillus caui]